MARLLCKCGESLSTVSAPNDVQLHVFTDIEWDKVINMGDLIDPLTIPDPKNEVWHCVNCDRIYFFNDDNTVNKIYTLEKE